MALNKLKCMDLSFPAKVHNKRLSNLKATAARMARNQSASLNF